MLIYRKGGWFIKNTWYYVTVAWFPVQRGRGKKHLMLNVMNKRDTLIPIDSFPDMESNILAVKYSIWSHHFTVSLIYKFIKLTINTYSILLGTSDCTRNDSVTGLGCSRKADEVTNRVTNTPSGLGYRKALAGIGCASSLISWMGLQNATLLGSRFQVAGCPCTPTDEYILLCSTSLFF